MIDWVNIELLVNQKIDNAQAQLEQFRKDLLADVEKEKSQEITGTLNRILSRLAQIEEQLSERSDDK